MIQPADAVGHQIGGASQTALRNDARSEAATTGVSFGLKQLSAVDGAFHIHSSIQFDMLFSSLGDSGNQVDAASPLFLKENADWGGKSLIQLMQAHGVEAEEIVHEPKGGTAEASRIRGHSLGETVKSIVVVVRMFGQTRSFACDAVRGDQRVDFGAVTKLIVGRHAGMA